MASTPRKHIPGDNRTMRDTINDIICSRDKLNLIRLSFKLRVDVLGFPL